MKDHELLRAHLLDVLRRDFWGPYDGQGEAISDLPIQRYSTGILFPRDTQFDLGQDDGGIGQESGTSYDDSESGLSMCNSNYPSSFGMSFFCKRETKFIQVTIKTANYTLSEMGGDSKPEQKSEKRMWKRNQIIWSENIVIEKCSEIKKEIAPKLSLRILVRPESEDGFVSITVSLINENVLNRESNLEDRCKKSFFQVYFCADGVNGSRPFISRNFLRKGISPDPEIRSMELLYRNVHSYAVGHGCSVDWGLEKDGMAGHIESSFVPSYPIYPLLQPEDSDLPTFSIKEIINDSAEKICEKFGKLHSKYEKWICDCQSEIKNISPDLQQTAMKHIEMCQECADRIKNGIKLLSEDSLALKAFKLAHRAMLYQFAHSAWAKAGKLTDTKPSYDSIHAWYPFQIAFILQCLESITESHSMERNIVDLLWFPTGGGKTEAYLGLTAYVLFLRRLKAVKNNEKGGGTAVITRYTLRLLTVDQFYRAALLACACEKVRMDSDAVLKNSAPITIGLWIGGDASPNNLEEARKALSALQNGTETITTGDPLKLRECPWCGIELGPADYYINSTGMRIKCPNKSCPYSSGLPVWIVDEDIYRERPSFLIGTVDKFARLPWIKEAGFIFGSDENSPPPELIIQDELHLISGPLGTLVGLYESGIDLLCSRLEGSNPKIIASTATIRNAQSQVESLFCRTTKQFPPSGLEYKDSFFAKEDMSKSARVYAGVFAPGVSPTTALIRTFGTLLHASHISNTQNDTKDPYWTLIGYFNSLRELGGARRQVEDDVEDYLKFCAARDGDPLNFRVLKNVEELTSRIDSSTLDDVRKNLWKKYPEEDCFDVVLATNMISVGLDVPRLGLMSIIGQPKSTAEYIQASSRIGRKFPGLVMTVYNWTRSRDRSHYERFRTYHSRIYSSVEATSVTPFSSRARDRGLHAVLIFLVRHLLNNMAENNSAKKFNAGDPSLLKIIKYLKERIERIDGLELLNSEQDLQEIIGKWDNLCKTCNELLYYSIKKQSLIRPADQTSDSDLSFPTLNSLRNIDPSVSLYLERI